TSQPLATQVALDILRQGGSAVDAAIAANAALGLMEPTGSGIGGDLFALVWDERSRRLYGLNASGRAAQGLTLQQLQRLLRAQGLAKIPPYGPLPVTVPGAVDGWFELHGRFGRLPLPAVLAPAIRYAREGFPVTEVIARQWERNARALADFPGFRATFMPGGRAPRKGEIFRNPRLADTLATLATEGRDAFYRGALTERMIAYLQAQGSRLSAADFAAHRSDWVEPIGVQYRGFEVWELPPNGQGAVALQMLNILEGFDLRSMGFGSADYLHVLAEAKKLAFEDRARYYADPDYMPVPIASLIAKPYAAARRARIDLQRAATAVDAGDPARDRSDTIYLTVADADGNMVSLIQSNYRGMGSGMTPDLGFVFHNRGEAFDVTPGRPNSYAPGKRPFHTIIPAFVTRDGKPYMSFGVMGGSMQPQGQVQVLVNHIDFGMNLQQAGDAPRLRHEGSSDPDGSRRRADGGVLLLEPGFSPEVIRELQRRGHHVRVTDEDDFGGYQAIGRDPDSGAWVGASESRKDGQAAGY
ncbi:MAG: gamma-glutamyltransferase, partial [Steroidobacteraceae bacterium]|nr:gamma-glutamyltransferase [Steroidobacteraceae bacterium]MDW8260664.1 gamma-glutamyltransferase [Gammaproteobacteria bacterium]